MSQLSPGPTSPCPHPKTLISQAESWDIRHFHFKKNYLFSLEANYNIVMGPGLSCEAQVWKHIIPCMTPLMGLQALFWCAHRESGSQEAATPPPRALTAPSNVDD